MKLFKSTTFFSFLLVPMLFSSLYSAIDVTSVNGTWSNQQGTPQPAFSNNFSGAGTNVIHWGVPGSGGSQQSGYEFDGNAPPTISNVGLDTPFAIGSFTHFNYPITSTGGSLTSVDLGVNLALNINGSPTAFAGTYHFLHNETPNNFDPPSDPRNNDIVTFQNNVAQIGNVVIDGINYSIGLVGFSTSPGGPLTQSFSTRENFSNTSTLYAQISLPHVFVPEPSTYLMMGTFLMVGAFAAYKRNKVRSN